MASSHTTMRRWISAGALTLLVVPLLGQGAARPVINGAEGAPAAAEAYAYRRASRDGIGKVYMGREISQVMGHLGAGWLERPDREREERTDRLVSRLRLEPDHVVADIGAGTGFFSFPVAARVPQGKVLAIDIQPEMLAKIEAGKQANGVDNVETVLGSIEGAGLREGSVDLAFIVDAYHEFSHPLEMGRSLARALVPGGKLVLVEYRQEDPEVAIKPLHKMSEHQAKKEIEALGLVWLATEDYLPLQHVLIFQKPQQ
jgi:FkbM family methyltransferase